MNLLAKGWATALLLGLLSSRGERRGKVKQSLDTGFLLWSSRTLLPEICLEPSLRSTPFFFFF